MSIADPQAFLASILQRQGLPGVAVDGSSTNSAKVPNPTDLAKTQTAKPAAADSDASAPANEKKSLAAAAAANKPLATEHSYAANPSQEETKETSGSGSNSTESSSSSEPESEAEEYMEEKVEERKTPTRGRGRPRKDLTSVNNTQGSSTPRPGRPRINPLKKKTHTPTSSSANSKQLTLTPRAVMSEGHRKRGKGCGGCIGCLREDCGSCIYCKDKPKFGGPGKKKQRCSLRVCSNFVNAPGVKRPTKSATNDQSPTSPFFPLKQSDGQASKETVSAVKELVKNTPPVTTISVTSTGSKTAMVTITTLPSTVPTTTVPSEKPKEETKEETDNDSEEDEDEDEEDKDDGKMQCVQCGRERLKSMARSDTFCTQRCAVLWEDGQPEGVSRVDAVPIARPKKHRSRELKNLRIDMALPGTTLPHSESSGEAGSSPTDAPMETAPPPPPPPLKKPSLRSNTGSPKPASPAPSSSAAKPTGGGIMKKTATPGSVKKASAVVIKKVEATGVAVTKRLAVSTAAAPAVKKVKIDATGSPSLPAGATTTSMARGVTFDLLPMTTLKPISAPPLNRSVPPPSMSIVPLDQLSALGDALQHRKDEMERSKFAPGLPKDIRSWSIPQVVQYFSSTPDCHDYADLFREQEVDGTALLLLSHESLVKCLNIKLGRALKIMLHVDELRKMYQQQ